MVIETIGAVRNKNAVAAFLAVFLIELCVMSGFRRLATLHRDPIKRAIVFRGISRNVEIDHMDRGISSQVEQI